MSIIAISDPHGDAEKTEKAIEGIGGLANKKLAVLGDVLDRGLEAVELTDYLINLLKDDKLILIRGNHEDLIEDALLEIERGRIWEVATASHHTINGTFDSLLQLAQMSVKEAVSYPKELVSRVKKSPYYQILLPSCVDFYETDKYILTHGWIACNIEGYGREIKYSYSPTWRNASKSDWRRARWLNGMELACKYHVIEPNKTIVCGHWHTSWGHSKILKKCSEWGEDAGFDPFYDDGIIAIDGCVAHSGKINCIMLED